MLDTFQASGFLSPHLCITGYRARYIFVSKTTKIILEGEKANADYTDTV